MGSRETCKRNTALIPKPHWCSRSLPWVYLHTPEESHGPWHSRTHLNPPSPSFVSHGSSLQQLLQDLIASLSKNFRSSILPLPGWVAFFIYYFLLHLASCRQLANWGPYHLSLTVSPISSIKGLSGRKPLPFRNGAGGERLSVLLQVLLLVYIIHMYVSPLPPPPIFEMGACYT